jgi:hypothetical protein
VFTMDPSQRRLQGLPKERMYAARTENNERNARNNAASSPSKKFCSTLLGPVLGALGYHNLSSHQKCPTPAMSSYQSTERNGSVTVDLECVSYNQSFQTQTSCDSSLHGRSEESRARDDLHLSMEEALYNPNLDLNGRISIVHGLWDQYETSLREQSRIEIVRLTHDCKLLTDAQADSLQQIRRLKESYNKAERRAKNLDSECGNLETRIAELIGHLKNSHNNVTAMQEDLQQQHDGIISLSEENQLLRSSLAEQQNFHQHESPKRPESTILNVTRSRMPLLVRMSLNLQPRLPSILR